MYKKREITRVLCLDSGEVGGIVWSGKLLYTTCVFEGEEGMVFINLLKFFVTEK